MATLDTVPCRTCQEQGGVTRDNQRRKGKISIFKLFVACMTFGISILFMGLRSHDRVQAYRCTLCGGRWVQEV